MLRPSNTVSHSSGTHSPPGTALMELPLVHAQAADVFLVFPLHEKHTPKCPLYQKWRASVGCAAGIRQPVLRRLPEGTKTDRLQRPPAGDGRHPVHAAGIHRKIGCLFDGADLLMVLACLLMSVMRLTHPCRERHRRCCCHRSRPAARVPAG